MEDLQMRNIDDMSEMDEDFIQADAAENDLEEEDEEPFTSEPEVYSEEEEMVEEEEITEEEEQEEEGLYGEEEEGEEESVREEEKPEEVFERFHPIEELPVGEEEIVGEREMTSDEALELEGEGQDKLTTKEEGWVKKVTDKVFRAVVKLSQRGVVQLVMIIVVILYTILGSLLFRMVEMQKDMDSRKKTIKYIDKMIDELFETAQDDTADYKIWELQLQEKLTDTSVELTAKNIWEDALAAKKESTVWTMEQTVYFCFTIFTSIGYGDFAPVTDFGRILTIAYGVIGIPVVVVALGDFGNRLEKILERICVVLIK